MLEAKIVVICIGKGEGKKRLAFERGECEIDCEGPRRQRQMASRWRMKMRGERKEEMRVEGGIGGMAGMGEDFRHKRAHAASASSSPARERGPIRGYISIGDVSKVRE